MSLFFLTIAPQSYKHIESTQQTDAKQVEASEKRRSMKANKSRAMFNGAQFTNTGTAIKNESLVSDFKSDFPLTHNIRLAGEPRLENEQRRRETEIKD